MDRESKNPSGTEEPEYTFLPTLRELILVEDWFLDALTKLYNFSGLEERTEWVRASRSSQASFVVLFIILLHSALAAVRAFRASLTCSLE